MLYQASEYDLKFPDGTNSSSTFPSMCRMASKLSDSRNKFSVVWNDAASCVNGGKRIHNMPLKYVRVVMDLCKSLNFLS